MPTITVVIPTSRAGDDLFTCLSSVENDNTNVEVIVVDNASPVESMAKVARSFAQVRILRNEENEGFVGACNQGIAASQGELILLLNDDAALEPGAFAALVTAIESRPSWGACQAKLLLMDDPTKLDTAGSFLTATGFLVHRGAYEDERAYSASEEIFAGKGAALLLRKSVLDEVGTFDPRFFAYFEESDLCWRIWLAGWEVGFAAEARVLHKLGATATRFPSPLMQFHSFKNRIRTLIKNLGPLRLAWMLPCHLTLCLMLAAWYAIRLRGDLSLAIIRAIGWNVIHLSETARLRRKIQRGRRVSDRVLMPRITQPTPLATLFAYARRAES